MNKLKIVLLCAVFVNGGIAMAQSGKGTTSNNGSSYTYQSNNNNDHRAEALAKTAPSSNGMRRGTGSAGNRNNSTNKTKPGKSGYTVLPQHPNAKSGMQRIKRRKAAPQAGNGGRATGKRKRGKGYKRGKYANCDAYM